MRRLAAALIVVGACLPANADAFYGNGAGILSASFARLEQGDDATTFAAVSPSGRYVVFQTRARNLYADDDPDPPGQYRVGGVFRFDLQTQALELVADGDFFEEDTNTFLVQGARDPSLSADGRFVSFSSAQQLVPQDTNGNIDVYLRDMSVPIRQPGAFELISVRDGGDIPAGYADQNGVPAGLRPGSDVTPGAAISLDGTKVVFRAVAASDLPSRPAPDTPGFNVFVRDRVANSTMLVTREAEGGEPAGGAFGASGGPSRISGDGTTVVWTGRNAAVQTRFINGENTDPVLEYYMWRRLADGAAAATRRITGVSDPDDPACPPNAEIPFDQESTGPCYGPLTEPDDNRADISRQLPALSADGRTVAYLTGASLRPNVTAGGPGLDLFLTSMAPGTTRKGSTQELTREGVIGDTAASSPIESIAMSLDGRWIAATSSRTTFVLPAFTFVGPRRQLPGIRELYVFDLEAKTLERAARAVGGGEIDGPVANGITVSADGSRLAFTSGATNLFTGDFNQRPDAFSLLRQPEPAPEEQPPPPGDGGGEDEIIEDDPGGGGPRLRLNARFAGPGAVQLRVTVPAAGRLRAVARARSRTLAGLSKRVPRAGRTALLLRLRGRDRAALRSRKTIKARVSVRFTPRSGSALSRSLRVLFRTKPPRKR